MTKPQAETLHQARIVIVYQTVRLGVPFTLYKFLRDQAKVRLVTFIGHPSYRERGRRSSELLSSGQGRQFQVKTFPRSRYFGTLSFIVDALLTLFLLGLGRRRYDLYIATSPLLVFLGIILRASRLVKKTVFWSTEYFPRRSANPLLNWLYFRVDGISAVHSDYLWDATPAMAELRRQRGQRLKRDRVFIVPHVLTGDELSWEPPQVVEDDSLVYTGLCDRENGFELIVEALPLVIRERPQVKLTVTSYMPLPLEQQERIMRTNLESHISFVGYVKDEGEFTKLLQKQRVGLAPYHPYPSSEKGLNESSEKGLIESSGKNLIGSGKIKTYIARRLPVIVTRVHMMAQEIDKEGAGIVINYDKRELAEAILKLLSDEQFYHNCQSNAFKLALKYRAEPVFCDTFRQMGLDVSGLMPNSQVPPGHHSPPPLGCGTPFNKQLSQ